MMKKFFKINVRRVIDYIFVKYKYYLKMEMIRRYKDYEGYDKNMILGYVIKFKKRKFYIQFSLERRFLNFWL